MRLLCGCHSRRGWFPLLAVLWFSSFLASLVGVSQACSILPINPEGPFMVIPYPNGGALLQSTDNPDLLGGTINYHNGVSFAVVESYPAAIDLRDGSVRGGSPNAVVTTPAETLADPTGGYQVTKQPSDSFVVITFPDTSTVNVPLEVSSGYNLLIDDDFNKFLWFASSAYSGKDLLYIFYRTEKDCGGLVPCPNPEYEPRYAIVDSTNTASPIYSAFDPPAGIFVYQPGPFNTLNRVYDSVQLAQLGFVDSCWGTSYIFYDDTHVRGAFVPPGFETALFEGAQPQDLTVFTVEQQTQDRGVNPLRGFPSAFYVTAFDVVEYSVVTGAELRRVRLNQGDIEGVAGRPCGALCWLLGLSSIFLCCF